MQIQQFGTQQTSTSGGPVTGEQCWLKGGRFGNVCPDSRTPQVHLVSSRSIHELKQSLLLHRPLRPHDRITHRVAWEIVGDHSADPKNSFDLCTDAFERGVFSPISQVQVAPPATSTFAPVVNDDRGDNSNAMVGATSSGSPTLPRGIRRLRTSSATHSSNGRPELLC